MVKCNYGFVSIIFILLWGSTSSGVYAQNQTFYYLSAQVGQQNLGVGDNGPLKTVAGYLESGSSSESDEAYLDVIAQNHGALKEVNTVYPLLLSFDFYLPYGSFASGLGVELHQYSKTYKFKDNSTFSFNTLAMLLAYTLYYRGDVWFPFVAVGTGHYTASFSERLAATEDEPVLKARFSDTVPLTLYYKLGVRIPFESWGIMASQYVIYAPLVIATENKNLNLGETTFLLGAYLAF
ncbi:hypothetical protein WDW89_11380 [Deltaproteobacteria bacterium TL4]